MLKPGQLFLVNEETLWIKSFARVLTQISLPAPFSILEVPKTDKSFEERLIFKTFILKFVNAFSPIIYIAFFRGR